MDSEFVKNMEIACTRQYTDSYNSETDSCDEDEFLDIYNSCHAYKKETEGKLSAINEYKDIQDTVYELDGYKINQYISNIDEPLARIIEKQKMENTDGFKINQHISNINEPLARIIEKQRMDNTDGKNKLLTNNHIFHKSKNGLRYFGIENDCRNKNTDELACSKENQETLQNKVCIQLDNAGIKSNQIRKPKIIDPTDKNMKVLPMSENVLRNFRVENYCTNLHFMNIIPPKVALQYVNAEEKSKQLKVKNLRANSQFLRAEISSYKERTFVKTENEINYSRMTTSQTRMSKQEGSSKNIIRVKNLQVKDEMKPTKFEKRKRKFMHESRGSLCMNQHNIFNDGILECNEALLKKESNNLYAIDENDNVTYRDNLKLQYEYPSMHLNYCSIVLKRLKLTRNQRVVVLDENIPQTMLLNYLDKLSGSLSKTGDIKYYWRGMIKKRIEILDIIYENILAGKPKSIKCYEEKGVKLTQLNNNPMYDRKINYPFKDTDNQKIERSKSRLLSFDFNQMQPGEVYELGDITIECSNSRNFLDENLSNYEYLRINSPSDTSKELQGNSSDNITFEEFESSRLTTLEGMGNDPKRKKNLDINFNEKFDTRFSYKELDKEVEVIGDYKCENDTSCNKTNSLNLVITDVKSLANTHNIKPHIKRKCIKAKHKSELPKRVLTKSVQKEFNNFQEIQMPRVNQNIQSVTNSLDINQELVCSCITNDSEGNLRLGFIPNVGKGKLFLGVTSKQINGRSCFVPFFEDCILDKDIDHRSSRMDVKKNVKFFYKPKM